MTRPYSDIRELPYTFQAESLDALLKAPPERRILHSPATRQEWMAFLKVPEESRLFKRGGDGRPHARPYQDTIMEHVKHTESKTCRRRRVSTCEHGEELRQALRAAPPLSERDKRMASGFIRVRDQRSKLAVLKACLHGTKNFKTPHLAVVFSREHRSGGIEYVGLKPTALTHKPDGKPATCVSLVFPDGSGPPVLLDVERIEYIDFLA